MADAIVVSVISQLPAFMQEPVASKAVHLFSKGDLKLCDFPLKLLHIAEKIVSVLARPNLNAW